MIDYIINSLSQGGFWMIPIIMLNLWGLYLACDLWIVQNKYSISSNKVNRLIKYPVSLIDWLNKISIREKTTFAGAALSRIYSHKNDDRATMDNVLDEELKTALPEIEDGLETIGIIASSAPLMGLLGTVSGMIETFHSISMFGAGNPAFMSKGIAEALIATQNGIIAAVPLMFAHMILTNKRNNMESQARSAGQKLINYLIGKDK
jgi:biopolymer transport protein ExbB